MLMLTSHSILQGFIWHLLSAQLSWMPMILERVTCVIYKGEYMRRVIHYLQVTDSFWSLLQANYPWIEREFPFTTSIFLDFASHQYHARISVLHPQSESLAVHPFTPFLLWTSCVTNIFTSWIDDLTLLPLHIQILLSVEPVRASVQHNCRAGMT